MKQPKFRLKKEVTTVKEVTKIILRYIKSTYPNFKFDSWVDPPSRYKAMREDNNPADNRHYGAVARLKDRTNGKTMFVRAGLHGVILGLSKPRQTITSHVEA